MPNLHRIVCHAKPCDLWFYLGMAKRHRAELQDAYDPTRAREMVAFDALAYCASVN